MNFFSKMTKLEAKSLNSIVLAYVGDAVHSLIVRENLVQSSDFKAAELHKMASQRVNAHSQALLADSVFQNLTQEEVDIFMRGRNGKSHHSAKNQTLVDYKKATAIEAVFGYLYLIGDTQRILQLLQFQEEEKEEI